MKVMDKCLYDADKPHSVYFPYFYQSGFTQVVHTHHMNSNDISCEVYKVWVVKKKINLYKVHLSVHYNLSLTPCK